MPRNTMTDLANHLFEQLERLSDEDLTAEQLELEIERSKAIRSISDGVQNAAKLVLDAERFKDQAINADVALPGLLRSGE